MVEMIPRHPDRTTGNHKLVEFLSKKKKGSARTDTSRGQLTPMDSAPNAARGGEMQVDSGLAGRQEGAGLDGRYPLLTQYWRRFTGAGISTRLLATLNIPNAHDRLHRCCRSCRQYGCRFGVSRAAGHGLPEAVSRRYGAT